jgi:hypothetical protein
MEQSGHCNACTESERGSIYVLKQIYLTFVADPHVLLPIAETAQCRYKCCFTVWAGQVGAPKMRLSGVRMGQSLRSAKIDAE